MDKNKLYNLSLFIFRRDLRLFDNTALISASKNSNKIIPCFFFDDRQIVPKNNPYFSSNSVQFMIESLSSLNQDLMQLNSKLTIFKGNLLENLEGIFQKVKINALYVNMDYTPFSVKRDQEIQELCNKYKIKFESFEDLLITNLHSVKTNNGTFSKVFTPYYKRAKLIDVNKPNDISITNYISTSTDTDRKILENLSNLEIKYKDQIDLFKLININFDENTEVHGGRINAEKILENLKNFKHYESTRNILTSNTSRLSAFMKFGLLSIRQVFHRLKSLFGEEHELIRQLHWRDFYSKISYFYPHVLQGSMKPEFLNINWQGEANHFELWKQGNTGFPIVDAAMRCLNKTGYMGNRLRMVVSCFLIKDLLIDWREGEKYFANKLVDYDASLNNGGWQWSAGTGTDAQPYFRVLNPWLQSQNFDEKCEYIYKWVPELKGVRTEHIHDWKKYNHLYKGKTNYPAPVVDHQIQKDIVVAMYEKYRIVKDGPNTYKEDEGQDQIEKFETKKMQVNSNKKTKKPADNQTQISSYINPTLLRSGTLLTSNGKESKGSKKK